MKRQVLNFVLLICLALLPGWIHAQQATKPVLPLLIKTDTVNQNNALKKQANLKPVLGKYDYYNSLGVACKAELKLEKATKIPFRFRLGSLQQTDYLERKPNAQKPE